MTGAGGITIASSLNSGGIVAYTLAQSYSGDTTVTANGTLKMGAVNALPYGAGAGNLLLGGTLDLAGYSAIVASLSSAGGGGVVTNTSGGTAVLTVNQSINTTYYGQINDDGPVALVKTGSGMLTISSGAKNTYSGGTTISAGILRTNNNNALGTGGLTANGGTLDLATFSPTVTSLSGSAGLITTIVNGGNGIASTLTVNQSGNTTFSGQITDGAYGVALVKQGTGSLTFNGASTFSGGASVQNSGTLRIGPAGSLSMPTAGVTVNNTSALVVDGALTANAVAVFHDTYPSGATLGGSGTITVGSGNLDYYSYASSTFGGQIAGVGQLWMENGQLTLSGSNSYTGGTFVQGGVLAAGAANALSPNSDVRVSGGTLDVSAYAQSIKSLALSGGVLDLGISGSYPTALTVSITNSASTLAFSGGTINVTGTQTTVQGLCKLISGYGATTGTFTQGTVPANYHLSATATELDLVHFATVFMTPATAINAPNVHTGPSTVGVQLNNGAPSGSDSAYYQLSTSVASSLSGSGTVAAQSAVQLSGSYTATAGANTLSVSCANVGSYGWANGVPSAVTITQHGYRLAAATISPTVNVGTIHVGDSFGTQALTVTNAVPADGFSESLDAAFGAATGAASNNGGSISLLAPQASNSTAMSVGLGSGAQNTAGVVSGTVPVNLTSDGQNSSNLGTTSLGTQTLSVSGGVFSGNGVWTGSLNGSWGARPAAIGPTPTAAACRPRRARSPAIPASIRRPSPRRVPAAR